MSGTWQAKSYTQIRFCSQRKQRYNSFCLPAKASYVNFYIRPIPEGVMSDSSKSISQYVILALLIVIAFLVIGLLAVVFWPSAESAESSSTPELAVVIFATGEATATAPVADLAQQPAEDTPVVAAPADTTGSTAAATLDNTTAVTDAMAKVEATPAQAAVAGVGFSESTTDATPTGAASVAGQGNSVSALLINRPPDINPLTGLKVTDPALIQRRPIMVRVGNDPGARPQVGLNEADLVYEEIVEWWVTRFTGVYLSNDPDMIAPIRSARLINLPLATQYQAALANSGASDPVRWELSQSEIANLDEFFAPEPYFYRPNEGWQTRLAFDAKAGRDYLANEGLDSQVKLRGFIFDEILQVNNLPQSALDNAETVIIPYPKQTSEARWVYDKTSGKYVRFIAGTPLVDFNGDQINASNVIIYFAEHQETNIVEDSNGATSIRIIVNGRGAAWLLRDGKVLKGNWETDGRETPLFIFDNGQPMPLKPGNTWIQITPLEYVIEIDGKDHGLNISGSDAPEPISGAVNGAGSTAGPTPTSTPIGARPQATPKTP